MAKPVRKLTARELEELVFPYARKTLAPDVVAGPGVGIDAGIVRLGDAYLVSHTDPVTAAVERAGWIAVNVACNDVAVAGARPRWASLLLLAPSDSWREWVERVMRDAAAAAEALGVSLVGGHTEILEDGGVVAVTAMGVARRVYPASNAKPGDLILMTKTAGLEGTFILATDYPILADILGDEWRKRAEEMGGRISVVREAVALAEAGVVDAMHDPTEGGVLGGVYELAAASGLEAVLYRDRVPVAEETLAAARLLGVDPLRLISSGSLIAAVPRERVREALDVLEGLGVEASIIGELRRGEPRVLVVEEGRVVEVVHETPVDEIYRVGELVERLVREKASRG